MLSFAVKWDGEKRVKTYALPDYPLFKRDKENDRDLVKDLYDVFDEADILIAHNGDRFDIRKSNARFIQHGLKPPITYKTIDTLKIARRQKFKFDSNRLNDLGHISGSGQAPAHWRSSVAVVHGGAICRRGG
jgi:DNA polymerase elongation subunit (family B)